MFKLVTWIVGFAAVVLGFAVKEGFEKGLEKVTHRSLLLTLGLAGLVVLAHATIIIVDHGRHINRTFARADAARDGESAPQKIWKAGKEAQAKWIPAICWELLTVVGLFAVAYLFLIVSAWFAIEGKALF